MTDKLGRRTMLRVLGWSGLALTVRRVRSPRGARAQDAGPGRGPGAELFDLGVFVAIAPSGEVVIVAHRSEMGQGSRTALAAVVADELEADWERVRVVQADGDPKYGSQNTDGSRSARRFFAPLREAGAAARTMLERAAAAEWGVDPSQCTARQNRVHRDGSDDSLGFGELSEAAAELPVPSAREITLKDPKDFRYVGPGKPSVDLHAMTTGAAVYGADVTRPGMLTAVIARPASPGQKPKSYDEEAARKVSGVRHVLELPGADIPTGFAPLGGVAVVADHTWAALKGRRALGVQWDDGPHAGYDSESYRAALERTVREPGKIVREQGDVDSALEDAATRVEAEYYVPHLSQTPMEPPAAVAEWNDGKVEVWAPTQAPQGMAQQIASTLEIDKEDVTVHVTFLGGGFGRKSKPDFGAEAALLSREIERPARVQWTRDDDLRHGFYHAVSAQRLEAGLDDEGKVAAWLHRTAQPSIGSTFEPDVRHANEGELGMGLVTNPVRVPAMRVENGAAQAHVRIGWLRSVANIYHSFAINSFVDELARESGRDVVELHRELVGEPKQLTARDLGLKELWNYGESLDEHPFDTGRLLGVLDRVAESFGWSKKAPKGHGKGIAVHRSFVSYVAAALEVRVRERHLQVTRAHIAIDCGRVLDADRVRAQLEGALCFGLSLSLGEAIEARGGAIAQSNYDDYPMLRMQQAPKELVTHIVRSEQPPAGVGEPGVPPIAPALANAIFDATGERVRALPVRKAGFVTV